MANTVALALQSLLAIVQRFFLEEFTVVNKPNLKGTKIRQATVVRSGWRPIITLATLFMLLLSVSAYADTYHFHFAKPKGEKGAVQPEQLSEPVATPKSQHSDKQTLKYQAGQTPIVINNVNTNNVGQTPAKYSVMDNANEPYSSRLRTYTPVDDGSGFRLSLAGMLMFQEFDYLTVNQGQTSTYTDTEEVWGGLVTLGYDFNKTVGLNVYGGFRVEDPTDDVYFHWGSDLEFTPFRIPASSTWDVVEFGLLAGFSNILDTGGNIGTIHIGSRLNINFAKSFGLTTSARANLGHVMFEAGFVTRL